MVFSSNAEFIKKIEKCPENKPTILDMDDYEFLLEPNLNVIMSEDNFTKTYFCAKIIQNLLNKGGSIIYIDCDTVFSAFIDSMIDNNPNLDRLFIFQPESETLDKMMIHVYSLTSSYLNLIVLDSITSFYHLFQNEKKIHLNKNINTHLSLLNNFAQRLNIPIIITSMTRAKETKKDAIKTWFDSPSGGRTLFKAKVILKITSKLNILEINVVRHEKRFLSERFFITPLKFE